jgi:type I restriction-modification system DNA methylase subunit
MNVPDRIKKLTETFDYNLETYKRGSYNETQVRREFIDPFFEELGWDITNREGYSEAYKDVIHEDAIKVGGITKAPDYCFRVGGARKFFLEAKKPSVNIKEDIHPAYQLRRYGWSAKLSVSILTDFEELSVYDCRVKPNKTDMASHSRILYLTYKDYIDRWEEIAGIFSREAILKGSFDKYVESKKAKKGTTEVDTAFLQEIERWRELLARNFALRNPELSQRELNFAVQKTIDRIVFLRICEDRGIESYGRLMALQNRNNIYKILFELFYKADEKYNSGLFHFKKEKGRETFDGLTPNLIIDDNVLKDIFKNLYYPDSPYEFSVLPSDILGQVYENFLGKVIRLTAKHRAIIEEKPEVRKAGGVYYTPTYVVDYIVKQTVEKLVEGKKPGPRGAVSKLKILDPACGSGSFLIRAYQYLLDWHRDQYLGNDKGWAKGKTPRIYQTDKGEWRLTTDERKRILLNNIYGVDIDPQAVEVTKLSLLLKVLEGEDEQSIGKQMALFQERVLPDLSNNIKCGNSLISPDFYDVQQMNLFDEDEIFRINVFHWNAEFFDIMENGGFDAVLGNPPWGASFSNQEKDYFRKSFSEIHMRTPESFNYFIYKMVQLTKNKGRTGVIVPSSFLNQYEFEKSRKYLVQNTTISRVCKLGDGVFHKVTAPSCILVFLKGFNQEISGFLDLQRCERKRFQELLASERYLQKCKEIGQKSSSFVLQPKSYEGVFKKCYAWKPLKEIAEDVATGISSGLDKAYIYSEKTINDLGIECDLFKKLVIGGEIHRYFLTPKSTRKIIYVTPQTNINEYPEIHETLVHFKDRLMRRREAANGKIPWFSLNWPRREKLFLKPKIIIRQTSPNIKAAYDDQQWYCLKSAIIIQLPENTDIHYYYLLSLLNSKLMDFLYNDLVGEQSRIFPEVKPVQLFKLPIREIDFNNSKDKALYDKLVEKVNSMLELNKKLIDSKFPELKITIKRQIDLIDSQIDQLVYKLYDLTDDEIKIVESET